MAAPRWRQLSYPDGQLSLSLSLPARLPRAPKGLLCRRYGIFARKLSAVDDDDVVVVGLVRGASRAAAGCGGPGLAGVFGSADAWSGSATRARSATKTEGRRMVGLEYEGAIVAVGDNECERQANGRMSSRADGERRFGRDSSDRNEWNQILTKTGTKRGNWKWSKGYNH